MNVFKSNHAYYTGSTPRGAYRHGLKISILYLVFLTEPPEAEVRAPVRRGRFAEMSPSEGSSGPATLPRSISREPFRILSFSKDFAADG
jgi:hypothetical protein